MKYKFVIGLAIGFFAAKYAKKNVAFISSHPALGVALSAGVAVLGNSNGKKPGILTPIGVGSGLSLMMDYISPELIQAR